MHASLWRPLRALVVAAAGAAAAFFLDPDRGRSRRARTRDRAPALVRRTGREASRRCRYLAGRARGVVARARGAGRPSPGDDRQVAEEVHRVLAGLPFPTADVTVEVVAGLARLRGQVATADEQARVEAAVSGAPGVEQLQSFLHQPGTPAPNKASALSAS